MCKVPNFTCRGPVVCPLLGLFLVLELDLRLEVIDVKIELIVIFGRFCCIEMF